MDKILASLSGVSDFLKQSELGALPASLMVGFTVILVLLFLWLHHRDRINVRHKNQLDEKIERLSALLLVNQQVHDKMKTATGGAVELNERFLRRLGADLHDGPAQSLGYALLRMQDIIDQNLQSEVSQELHSINHAVKTALDEIRSISTGLVLPELGPLTLRESLENAITRHLAYSDITIEPYFIDLPEQIAMPLKICAFRFIQESLSNAHKHGAATKCHIQARLEDDVFKLAVKDNGKGFRLSTADASGTHLGLVGLKDRIISLGGEFEITSDLNVGTRIAMSMPIN